MIVEHARIRVRPGQGAAFEAAVAEAATSVLPKAQGFLRVVLYCCIEERDTYICAIEWERLEDHVVGFREGPLFARWRALVGPSFAAPPDVLHYEVVAPEPADRAV